MGALADLIAINPDGTERWRVIDPDFDSIKVGPAVGPDGNIYALTTDNANGGLGVFSVTPEGVLRWNQPGFFRPRGDPHGKGMAFDAFGQVYTPSPGIGPNVDPFYALSRENGKIVLSRDGANQWPPVNPAGDRIYAAIYDPFAPASLVAFEPEGSVVFSVLREIVETGVDVGPDGNIYVGVAPRMSPWSIRSEACAGTFDGSGIRYDPIVSPGNQVVVAPGYEIAQAGFV